MPRSATILVFIGVVLSVLGGVHWYVWARLVSAPEWPMGVRRGLTALVAVLFAAVWASFIFGRGADFPLKKALSLTGYVWLGVLFILFSLTAGVDALRFVGGLVQRLAADLPPADPERRVVSARLLAGIVGLFGLGASAAALYSGLGPVAVKRVRVRLPRLPRSLDGTTIVQLSDVHVGTTIGREFIEDIVSRVNALGPDLVAITGDLVDGSVASLGSKVAPLGGIQSKYGTFFVTGNHEYYSGATEWCAELARIGIRVLRNERVQIGPDGGADSFDLAGIDDHEARRFGGKSNLKRALEGRDPSREVVLLAHQPRAVFEADQHGVGLQLSGHTHGGQIWPWNYLVLLQQPVVAGLKKIGQTLVYVSCGTGYWGPPMRLKAPAEITHIVLESGAA
jgi:predicted MPP superfamily phosphohydrolase